jgi:signal peptidase
VILRRLSSLVLVVFLMGAAGIGLLAAAPGFLGLHSVVVAGGSMTPTIPLGSVAISRTISIDDVNRGDIVVFVPPGGHVRVMHRVVQMKRRGQILMVRTKGDANDFVDPHRVQMKGTGEEVVAHIPYVGYVLHWIHMVPLMALVIPLLLLALTQPLINLIRLRGRRQTARP